MAKHLKKEDLEKLTSHINYSYFERGDTGCEGLHFYSTVKNELEETYQNYDFLNISDKIVRALCYIYNKKKNKPDKFDSELCPYLYYWIGSKIYPIVKDKKVFLRIISMIYDEFYSSDFFNTCTVLYNDIDEDTFNTYKMLHDYSKDYVNIEIDTSHGHTTCDTAYKEFIENYISIYKETHKDCFVEKTKNYDCHKIFSLFEKKTYDDLTSYSCIKGKPQSFVLNSAGKNVDHSFSSSGVRTLGRTSGLQAHPGTDESPRDQVRSASYQNPGLGRPYESDGSLSLPVEVATGDSSSKTIAGSVVPVLGVSSFSLLLYKVTPVGGFINRFLGRNRNIYNPMEYVDGFNPYNDGMVPGDRRMNISYHRL